MRVATVFKFCITVFVLFSIVLICALHGLARGTITCDVTEISRANGLTRIECIMPDGSIHIYTTHDKINGDEIILDTHNSDDYRKYSIVGFR